MKLDGKNLSIDRLHLRRLVLPRQLLQNPRCFRFQLHRQRLFPEDGQNTISNEVRVPEVDFEGVVEDFGCARLFTDDDGRVVRDRFEGDEAEGFAEGGHDEAVGFLVQCARFAAADAAGECDTLLEVELDGEVDETGQHRPVAGHHKLRIGAELMDAARDLEELAWIFLHREAAEEEDQRALRLPVLCDQSWFDRRVRLLVAVVDDHDFVAGDAVVFLEEALGVAAHGDHLVRTQEPFALSCGDPLVGMEVRAIQLRGVDVCHEWLVVMLRRVNARVVRHPVVAVDHIGIDVLRHADGECGEVVDGRAEVGAVEFFLIGGNVRRAQGVGCGGIVGLELTLNFNDGRNFFGWKFDRQILFALRLAVRKDECYAVAVMEKPAHQTLTRHAQTARVLGRVFPAEHEGVERHECLRGCVLCVRISRRARNLKSIAERSQNSDGEGGDYILYYVDVKFRRNA